MATTPTDPIPAASQKLATAINEFVQVVVESNAAAPSPAPVPAPPAPTPAPPAPVPAPPAPAPVPAPPAPAPTPAPAPAPVASAGDIVDSKGAVIPAARLALVKAAGTEAWVDYVRGPQADAATQAKGFAIPATPITKPFPANQGESKVQGNYGTWQTDPGLYSTAQADVIGVPVTTDSSGTVTVQESGYSHGVAELIPQGRWQNGYGLTHDNIVQYRKEGTLPATGKLYPTFVTTNDDLVEDNGPSRLIGFASKQVVGAGGNTAMNKCRGALPGNRMALAGSMTGSGELLCVPCFNFDTGNVELAIAFCAGRADGVAWTEGQRAGYDWWQEWNLTYPGMPNRGNTVFVKFVHFQKLDLALPTSVQCSTGMHPWKLMTFNGRPFMYDSTPITDHLADLRDGGPRAGGIARGGACVVGSPSDGKFAVLDLYPIFEYIWQSYLGANPQKATPDKLGLSDAQWPPVGLDGIAPLPVQYFTPGGRVQDLRLTPTSGMLYVASNTGDVGAVQCWDLSSFQPSATKKGLGNFSTVKKVGELGGLPFLSHMALVTGYKATIDDPQNLAVHITSRKFRALGTVNASADFKTLKLVQPMYTPLKSQVLDPVAQGDYPNYANASNAQIVLDFKGQKLAAFRTDLMDLQPGFPDQPKPATVNGVRVVFEGSIAIPDVMPWDIAQANVP